MLCVVSISFNIVKMVYQVKSSQMNGDNYNLESLQILIGFCFSFNLFHSLCGSCFHRFSFYLICLNGFILLLLQFSFNSFSYSNSLISLTLGAESLK